LLLPTYLSSPIEEINSLQEEHNPSSSPIASVRTPFIVFVEGAGGSPQKVRWERVSIYQAALKPVTPPQKAGYDNFGRSHLL